MKTADSLEKTLTLGKIRQEEKGATEDEMVGWHHCLNGHELKYREAWCSAVHGVMKSQT